MVDAGLGCISIKIRLVILMSNFIDFYFNPRENELAQLLLTIIKAKIVEVNEQNQ
jgi:hypothetical protein